MSIGVTGSKCLLPINFRIKSALFLTAFNVISASIEKLKNLLFTAKRVIVKEAIFDAF